MSITEQHYTSGDYWRDRGAEDSAYKADLAMNALACANIELRPGLRAVEIGSGSGGFILPLAERLNARFGDFSLSGYDIAPNAVELAKCATKDKRIKFSIGSVKDIKDKYDIVFLMDVVEHVTDPYWFLESVRDIAPLVVMHIPIEQSLAHAILSRPLQSYELFHHVHFFSIETLRLLIQETGYEIVKMQFSSAFSKLLYSPGHPLLTAARAVRYCSYKIAPRMSGILMGGEVMVVLRSVGPLSY